jgi:hypothetical protein
MAAPSYGQGQGGAGAAHVWKREWVKGAPGTAPFPSQVGTPSPLAGAVTIISGTVAQLPQPPNPLALSGSLGSVVNTVTGKQTLYMFNGMAWMPLLNTTASGSGGGGGGISSVTLAAGPGISVGTGPAYTISAVAPVAFTNQNNNFSVAQTYLTGAAASGNVAIRGDAGSIGGLIFNVPTGSTNGWNWWVGETTAVARLTTGGNFIASGQITASGATLANPLTIGNGGTGSTTAAITAGGGISASGTFPNQTIYATVALPSYPLTAASGGTGVTSLAALSGTSLSGVFVILTPAAAQTGTINISGKISTSGGITAGSAFIGTTGDVGAARAASSAGYWYGTASGTAGLVDYGATTAGVYTFGDGSARYHPLFAGSSVTGTTGTYCPPMYNGTGGSKAATGHLVKDSVTAVGISTTFTLTGASAFTNSVTYFVFDNTALVQAVITAQALNSVTFTSSNTHTYSVFAAGD